YLETATQRGAGQGAADLPRPLHAQARWLPGAAHRLAMAQHRLAVAQRSRALARGPLPLARRRLAVAQRRLQQLPPEGVVAAVAGGVGVGPGEGADGQLGGPG